jgi:hypothetical protein
MAAAPGAIEKTIRMQWAAFRDAPEPCVRRNGQAGDCLITRGRPSIHQQQKTRRESGRARIGNFNFLSRLIWVVVSSLARVSNPKHVLIQALESRP